MVRCGWCHVHLVVERTYNVTHVLALLFWARVWNPTTLALEKLQLAFDPVETVLVLEVPSHSDCSSQTCGHAVIMRNAMVQDRIKRARTRFIESIDRDAIPELASSHHQNVSCRFFKPLRHGGFNVCFFVEFESPDSLSSKDRWVVRVPIPGRTPVAWIDEKLEVEVATMKYVGQVCIYMLAEF